MSGQPSALEIASAVQKLKDEFEKVEKLLKHYELSSFEAFIPAINELRYAGFHALSAYETPTGKWDIGQINRAIAHCRRAYCDTIDATVLFVGKSADWFLKLYKGHSEQVYTVLPNLEMDWQDVEDIHIKVRYIRSKIVFEPHGYGDNSDHFDLDERTDSLERFDPDLKKIFEYFDRLRRAAPRIDRLIREKKENDRQNQKRQWRQEIFIGVFCTLLGGFLTWLFTCQP